MKFKDFYSSNEFCLKFSNDDKGDIENKTDRIKY